MKNITSYINESVNKTSTYNSLFGPIVKALEDEGYTIKSGAKNEDFNLVDLIVSGRGNNFTISVNANDEKHKKSKTFTFTMVSNSGKEFPFDKNNSFAFVDEVVNEIYLVKQDEFYEKFGHFSTKDGLNDNSKCISVSKTEVAKLGRVISY